MILVVWLVTSNSCHVKENLKLNGFSIGIKQLGQSIETALEFNWLKTSVAHYLQIAYYIINLQNE